MRRLRTTARRRRSGFLTPALALAVLTAFLAAAVALNLAWRRTADRQVSVAADSAALAAASELVCDERLLDQALPGPVIDRVGRRAEELASRHTIAGVPVLPAPDQIRIGRVVTGGDGRPQLIETDYAPTTVALLVHRGRDGQLPWLFRAGGVTSATLAAAAEAAVDDRVAALRPRTGGTVPVWPMALREKSSAANAAGAASLAAGAAAVATASAGWADQIDLKLGGDRFGFDADSGQVVGRGDGLPELVVTTLRPGGEPDEAGWALVDVGQTFGIDRLGGAMRDGLTADDLGRLGGEVPVAALSGSPVAVDALPQLPVEAEQALRPGQARALFLFDGLAGSGDRFQAQLTRVVVARLMDLSPTGDGRWRATFQPAVLATGTALLAAGGDAPAPANRYLYKVRLTR